MIAMQTLAEKLKHILIPLVTPFKENGDVNYAVAEELADFVIKKEYCDSIVVTGTTGEFNTLSSEERVELFKVVKNTVDGRVPLVAGTGAASAREAVKLTQEAERFGYDAAMVVGPYYCKPTQAGIFRYFETIATSVAMPIMLYNIPIFTGMNIEPETVSRLAEIENIMGIKDEAGINPTQMTDYALVTPDDFTIYNGDDIMVLCGLVQGAAGVVSGVSHICGHVMRDMIDAFLSGQMEKARRIHMALYPLLKAEVPNKRIHPNPVLRAGLEMIGIPVGPPRLPLDEPTPAEKEQFRQHLIRLQII
jgi:4-hydroxy-tetrahydrodipicolinate synthase